MTCGGCNVGLVLVLIPGLVTQQQSSRKPKPPQTWWGRWLSCNECHLWAKRSQPVLNTTKRTSYPGAKEFGVHIEPLFALLGHGVWNAPRMSCELVSVLACAVG